MRNSQAEGRQKLAMRLPAMSCRRKPFLSPWTPLLSLQNPTAASSTTFPFPQRVALPCSAHWIVTHSCRPGNSPRRTGYCSSAVVPNQKHGVGLRLTRPLCGPATTVVVRDTTSLLFSLRGLLGMCTLPTPQPFPTDFRQFPGRRHPCDLPALERFRTRL